MKLDQVITGRIKGIRFGQRSRVMDTRPSKCPMMTDEHKKAKKKSKRKKIKVWLKLWDFLDKFFDVFRSNFDILRFNRPMLRRRFLGGPS